MSIFILKRKTYSVNSLLEKAFCEGYYYAQKEFGKISIKPVVNKIKSVFSKKPQATATPEWKLMREPATTPPTTPPKTRGRKQPVVAEQPAPTTPPKTRGRKQQPPVATAPATTPPTTPPKTRGRKQPVVAEQPAPTTPPANNPKPKRNSKPKTKPTEQNTTTNTTTTEQGTNEGTNWKTPALIGGGVLAGGAGIYALTRNNNKQ